MIKSFFKEYKYHVIILDLILGLLIMPKSSDLPDNFFRIYIGLFFVYDFCMQLGNIIYYKLKGVSNDK